MSLFSQLPAGIDWMLSVGLAFGVFLAGMLGFRLVVKRLIGLAFRSPEVQRGILGKLIVPYYLLLAIASLNGLRGVVDAKAEYWLGALLAPAIAFLVIESLRVAVVDYLVIARSGKPIPRIIRDVAFGVVYLTVGMVLMGTVFKVDVGPFLTTSAILSIVLGMALQDTLGNLFAGVAINLDPPFSIGDWVSIDGQVGQVVEITWRATKIVTRRQETLVFPNNTVSKAIVMNYHSAHGSYAEAIDIHLSYQARPNQVREAVLRVAAEVPEVLSSPVPELQLLSYGEYAVNYRILVWIRDFARSMPIRSMVQERLWYHLRRQGIEIPLPARTVTLRDEARIEEQQQRQTLKTLRKIDIFAPVGAEDLERLARKAKRSCFSQGETIVRQGDPGGSLFLIRQGAVSLYIDEGATGPIALLEEGSFFGEISLLTGEPRNVTVRAAEDCELMVLEKRDIQPLLEDRPEFLSEISRIIAERQQHTERARAAFIERQATSRIPEADSSKVEEASNEIFHRIRDFFKLS